MIPRGGVLLAVGAASVTLLTGCLSEIPWGNGEDPSESGNAGMRGQSGMTSVIGGTPSQNGTDETPGTGILTEELVGAGGKASSPPSATGGAGGAGGAGAGGSPDERDPLPCATSADRCLELSTVRLPAPCAGIPYSEELSVIGGTPPYTWQAEPLSTPAPDLTLVPQLDDTSHATLQAVASTGVAVGGMLRVTVTDAAPPGVQQTTVVDLDLNLRTSCWFAYLSDDSPTTRLHFRDVFLANDIVLPQPPHGDQPVVDFKFSPDGSWLAFRVGTAPSYRLFLYPTAWARSGQAPLEALPISFSCPEVAPPADCGVVDYAWADNSRYLAVMLSGTTVSQDYLSGLDVAHPEAPWALLGTADWAGIPIALDYTGQLTFARSAWVGFLGADIDFPDDGPTLYSAFLGGDESTSRRLEGLQATLSLQRFRPSLRSIPSGISLTDHSESPSLAVFTRASTESGGRVIDRAGRLSPSGKLIATVVEEDRLQLLNLESPDALPVDSERGVCRSVLAWSNPIGADGTERIACSTDGGLRILDYTDPPPSDGVDLPATLRLGPALEVAGSLVDGRRIFSPSGRWLLLEHSDATGFTLRDLLRDSHEEVFEFDSTAEVKFAVGRSAISFADTSLLIEYHLPRSPGELPRPHPTHGGVVLAACGEGVPEPPMRWCGAPDAAAHFTYSPTSENLLFEGPSGTLNLADMSTSPAPDANRVAVGIPTCTDGCLSSPYTFQP